MSHRKLRKDMEAGLYVRGALANRNRRRKRMRRMRRMKLRNLKRRKSLMNQMKRRRRIYRLKTKKIMGVAAVVVGWMQEPVIITASTQAIG
jgi:hypothetical protein